MQARLVAHIKHTQQVEEELVERRLVLMVRQAHLVVAMGVVMVEEEVAEIQVGLVEPGVLVAHQVAVVVEAEGVLLPEGLAVRVVVVKFVCSLGKRYV